MSYVRLIFIHEKCEIIKGSDTKSSFAQQFLGSSPSQDRRCDDDELQEDQLRSPWLILVSCVILLSHPPPWHCPSNCTRHPVVASSRLQSRRCPSIITSTVPVFRWRPGVPMSLTLQYRPGSIPASRSCRVRPIQCRPGVSGRRVAS